MLTARKPSKAAKRRIATNRSKFARTQRIPVPRSSCRGEGGEGPDERRHTGRPACRNDADRFRCHGAPLLVAATGERAASTWVSTFSRRSAA
jgi:hypothetical protein